MRRPGWVAGISCFVTCLVGAWLSADVLRILLTIGVASVGISFGISALRRCRTLLLTGVTVCVALFLLLWQQRTYETPLQQTVGHTVTLQAQVCEVGNTVVLQVEEGDLPKGTRLYFWNGSDEFSPQLYDILSGSFQVYEQDSQGIWGMQARANGLKYAVAPADWNAAALNVQGGKAPWTAVFPQLRDRAVEIIGKYLSGDIAATVSGVCLGVDEELSAEAQSAFRVSGVSHLFSVSGFHLAVIAQGLLWAFRKCRLPRWLCGLSATLAMLFLMALVGLEPSVVRAGVLCLLVQLSTCTKRQADTYNSLGIALLILLLGNPFAAYDVGLLLSFFATFGLVSLAQPMSNAIMGRIPQTVTVRFPKLIAAINALVTAGCLSLSATVMTLPVSAIYFQEISLVSLPANLLSSYPASILLIAGGLACLVFAVGLGFLVPPFLLVAGLLSRYLLWITEKISEFPAAMVAIQEDFLVLWLIGSLLLLFLGHRLLRRRGLAVAALVSVMALIASLTIRFVTTEDVSQIRVIATEDDTAVCVQSNDRTMLFLSPASVDDLYTIRTQLRRDGIEQIDVLVVPDGNDAAVGVIPAVLDAVSEHTVFLYTEKLKGVPSYYSLSEELEMGDQQLWSSAFLQYENGFFLLSFGETQLLIVPPNGDAEKSPEAYRGARVAICRGDAVYNTHLLQPHLVVSPTRRGAARFPTAGRLEFLEDGAVVLATRGFNDIYY